MDFKIVAQSLCNSCTIVNFCHLLNPFVKNFSRIKTLTMNSGNIPTTVVKVTYVNPNNEEFVARRIPIDKDIKLDEFHKEIRSRFNIISDIETEIHYKDEDNDRIIVTYDDEFQAALKSNPPAKFELVIKSISNKISKDIKDEKDKLIKARITYCGGLCGDVGDYNEVVFKSHDLTLDKSMGGYIWGTKIYTSDSSLLKALVHSHSVKLSKTPPPYDIIATVKILPGQSSYLGSYSNGINTLSYGAWDSSFSIESIRYEPITNSSTSKNKYKDQKRLGKFWIRIVKFFF